MIPTTESFRSSKNKNITKPFAYTTHTQANICIFDVHFEFMSTHTYMCFVYTKTITLWSDSCPITILMVVILRSDISSNEIHFIPSLTLKFMYMLYAYICKSVEYSLFSVDYSAYVIVIFEVNYNCYPPRRNVKANAKQNMICNI